MNEAHSILITGASSGIGAALARAYARPGVTLALTGRNAERLDAVADACRAAGAALRSELLDVADEGAMRAWIEAIDRQQPLDLVIANAGMTGGFMSAGEGESPADVHRMMSINFEGVCNTIHPVIPAMRRRRCGHLALMSSLAALRGMPYSPAYCASKAAVKTYGDALRTRLRPEGIEVSVILAGFVDTRLSRHVSGPKPLQMAPERAARIIRNGLSRGHSTIAFPYSLYVGTRILAALPTAWTDRLLNAIPIEIQRYE
jgi:short-subunit dehydrogenase